MAKSMNIKIVCQECGKENEVTIWQSIIAQTDIEQFNQLLSGQLFVFKCSECGKQGHLNYDMACHDMVHRTIIHYAVSDESHAHACEAADRAIAEKGTGVNSLTDDYRIRVVRSQNALREKALLFTYGMDDRIMEILKGMAVINIKKDHPELKISEVLFLTNNGKWIVQVLGEKPASAEIPMTKYDEIRRLMSKTIETTEIRKHAVDAEWALRVVKQPIIDSANTPQG